MMRRPILIALSITFLMISYSYCQEQKQGGEIKTVRGVVSQINWPAQAITVKWLQTEGDVGYDEVTIFVPDNILINQGVRSLGLAELQIGSQVTVKYLNVSPGPLKATSITLVTP